MFAKLLSSLRLLPIEKVRMIANLSELNDYVLIEAD
jgi:hypothetical protein